MHTWAKKGKTEEKYRQWGYHISYDKGPEGVGDGAFTGAVVWLGGEKLGSLALKGISGLFAKSAAEGGAEGGLSLFKFKSAQAEATTGWKTGDRFLNMFDQGSPKLNWKQNSGFLRREMGVGNPIFDSYLKADGTLQQTRGFLNAERYLLESRGWNFNTGTGAWMPPR